MQWYRNFRRYFSNKLDEEPILISHHPLCGRFNDHMIDLAGRKVCLGCLFVYPSMVVTLIFIAILTHFYTINYIISLEFAIITFLINLLRIKQIKNKIFSILLRIDLGISLGLAIYTIWVAPVWIPKLVVIYFVVQVASVYIFYRGLKALKTCENCDQHDKFPECSRAIIQNP